MIFYYNRTKNLPFEQPEVQTEVVSMAHQAKASEQVLPLQIKKDV